MPKMYKDGAYYERKLDRVMERLGVADGDFDFYWSGRGREAWVEFNYEGDRYRFDYTIERAQAAGQDIRYASDCFAKIVLTLERLVKIVEDGIAPLGRWASDFKALPAPIDIPSFFRALGFDRIPGSVDDVHAAYRAKAKVLHPDTGADGRDFEALQAARRQALAWFAAAPAAR